jgi:hypothetical protein
MTSVYSTQDLLIIGHLRNVLVNEGIRCDVRTPFLGAAKGDIPVTDCWSELRILDDEDVDRAREVMDAALAPSTVTERPWPCPKCGESIDGQFDACWQCGSGPTSGKST